MSVSATIAGSVVQNNLIGTPRRDRASGDLGNTIAGVAILGLRQHHWRHEAPGQANTIAYNGKAGSVLNSSGVGVVTRRFNRTRQCADQRRELGRQ